MNLSSDINGNNDSYQYDFLDKNNSVFSDYKFTSFISDSQNFINFDNRLLNNVLDEEIQNVKLDSTIKKIKHKSKEFIKIPNLFNERNLQSFDYYSSNFNQQNKRRCWTLEEDQKLLEWVNLNGRDNWRSCHKYIGRKSKQCRERWHNSLDPNSKKGNWTEDEDKLLFDLYKDNGTKWSKFSKFFKGRTENSLKNRFYSTLRRISNLDSKSKEKKTPKELLLYVPKVFENFKKTSNILKISDKRTFVDSLLNSYSNTIKNYQLSNSIDHRQLINKNYQEYQKLSENELEENIRDLCNSNPFIESIPIRVQINQKVDRFMDEFFTVDKKICQKFEFCAICKNPKDFNAEKEKKSLGSFAYEIEQLDEFMNDLKNLEKTIIENTKVIKLVNDIYEKRDL